MGAASPPRRGRGRSRSTTDTIALLGHLHTGAIKLQNGCYSYGLHSVLQQMKNMEGTRNAERLPESLRTSYLRHRQLLAASDQKREEQKLRTSSRKIVDAVGLEAPLPHEIEASFSTMWNGTAINCRKLVIYIYIYIYIHGCHTGPYTEAYSRILAHTNKAVCATH